MKNYIMLFYALCVATMLHASITDPSMTEEEVTPAGKNLEDTKKLIKQKLATIQTEIEISNKEKWKSFERHEPAAQDIIDKIAALRLNQDDLQSQLLTIENTLQNDHLYSPRN